MKYVIVALTALVIAGCSSSSLSEPIGGSAAVLTVVFDANPTDTIEVLVTDSATIAAAEAYVATKSGPRLVSGQIVKGAGFDTRYPFHFVASSVRLVDFAIEICDGAPMKTAQDVSQFFEWSTGNASSASAQWCPWGSSPLKVTRVQP